jgi:hypothetical protein
MQCKAVRNGLFRPSELNLAGRDPMAKARDGLATAVSDSKFHEIGASSFALTMRRLSSRGLLDGHFWSPLPGVARLSRNL